MSIKRLFAGLLVGTAMAVGVMGAGRAAAQERIVKVDGSSTVFPITEAVAEEFQTATKTKVTVGVSGTGGGFKKFCRGETDISNASRPILTKEIDDAKAGGIEFIELPIAFDALTVVIHPQNTWATTMTVEELKKIWEPGAQGKVTKWSHVRAGWPDEEIKLFGAGTDSGTFDYFTEAIVGKAKSSRSDYTASEDDNVLVRGVEGSKYSLGYFGYSYYAAHKGKLVAVKIDNGKGAVVPSKETVLNGTYTPLSRPLFIYVSRKSVETKPFVREFVDFYLNNVKKLAEEVKYVPLPDSAYDAVKSRFGKMETGTVFGGVPDTHMTIDEIVKKELSK